MKLPFTKQLLSSLMEQGYTHIQQRGIEPKAESSLHTKQYFDDDYILVPWKKDILLYEEASLQLLEIDSPDVADMLDVEFGIRFLSRVATFFYRTTIPLRRPSLTGGITVLGNPPYPGD